MEITPHINQYMIAVSPLLAAFSVGGAVVYPSLLMEHLKADNSSVPLDVHTKSWIGSIYGLAGIPVILMPIITQKIGRKFGFIITGLYVLLGWILTFASTTATEIIVSECFHGLGINSLLPISYQCMSEMLAPKYRPISMQAFGIAQTLGMATSGILGRFYHFKTISIIMFIPIAIAVSIAVLWPESPAWLACKGEFSKCEQAFIKLRGPNKTCAKELSDLITAQREILSRESSKRTLNDLWRQIRSRDFYIPASHIFVLMSLLYWSGCDVFIIYFIDLASKSTTNSDVTFYATIVMYVIIIVGMIAVDFLIMRFDLKLILLTSAFFVMVFLICGSVVTGLQTIGILEKDSLLFLVCMLLCILSAACGVDSLVFVISGELMPVKHRSLGGAFYVISNCLLYASSQKLSPYLVTYIDLWGTFLLYAINAFCCGLFVWNYVPETKRRSLQEIEDFYRFGKFVNRNTEDLSILVSKPDKELQIIKYVD